jgi:hypothetical protein
MAPLAPCLFGPESPLPPAQLCVSHVVCACLLPPAWMPQVLLRNITTRAGFASDIYNVAAFGTSDSRVSEWTSRISPVLATQLAVQQKLALLAWMCTAAKSRSMGAFVPTTTHRRLAHHRHQFQPLPSMCTMATQSCSSTTPLMVQTWPTTSQSVLHCRTTTKSHVAATSVGAGK